MSMKDEHNEKGEERDEDELDEQHDHDFDPHLPVGEDEEEDYISQLDQDSSSVNGDDQKASWMHQWKAVEHPNQAVHKGREVRDRRELLDRSLLPYRDESRPENEINYKHNDVENQGFVGKG